MVNFTDSITHTNLNSEENIIVQIAALTYYIWYACNLSIFEEIFLPEEDIISKAARSTMDFQLANSSDPKPELHDNISPQQQ